MPTNGIPDYKSLLLTEVGGAGGSNGARIARGRRGNHWIIKHYSAQTDRVATEMLANAIYRELGILVPNAGVTEWVIGGHGAETALAYPMLDGVIRPWGEPNEALAEGLVADAPLANWDVIGLEHDNILWPGEIPIRLDQGGTFEIRAQGNESPTAPNQSSWKRCWSRMAKPGGRLAVTEDSIEKGCRQAIDLLPPNRVLALVAAAPFADRAMADRISDSLNHRIAWLGQL